MASLKIKSVYASQADDIKAKLDSVGPGMCLAKWQQVSINLTAGLTHSCYHPRPHRIPLDELSASPSALHNTSYKKSQRKLMLEGQRPQECGYCWKIEDAGHVSDRLYRSGEPWAAETFEMVVDKPWDWDVVPRYVEVNFNQACNLKCSYCSPHLSSTWMQEAERFGPYPTRIPHNSLEHLRSSSLMPIPHREHNPYVEAFWKWWPELYKSLKHFRMTGGEPLMDRNTFKVLDFIEQNPKLDLEIAVTSNLSVEPKLFERFLSKIQSIESHSFKILSFAEKDHKLPWQEWTRYIVDPQLYHASALRDLGVSDFPTVTMQEISDEVDSELKALPEAARVGFTCDYEYVGPGLKHVAVFVSFDSWGERAEYIRNGLDFNRMLENIRSVLRETHITSITVINTFNALSVSSLKEFLAGILMLRGEVADFAAHGKPSRFYDRQRVWFDLPLLHSPAWQSIMVLPEEYATFLEDALTFMEDHHESLMPRPQTGFKDFEIEKARRNLDLFKQASRSDMQRHLSDFHAFFTEHDVRRDTDIHAVFPEMVDFFEACKSEGKQHE